MIVVDTNILVYLHVPGEFTARAEAQWALDSSWAMPPLWRSEFNSALVGYLRRGTVSLAEALQRLAAAAQHVRTVAVVADEVLRLAARSPCSAYDLEFVVLARQLDVPLVTLDRAVLRAFPDVARPLP